MKKQRTSIKNDKKITIIDETIKMQVKIVKKLKNLQKKIKIRKNN